MAVQNESNLYTTTISDTLAAYSAFFGVLTNADTADAIQKSRTKSMQLIFTDFKTKVSDAENLVAYKLKKDSPAYQEFFPQGVTEYSKSNLENVETLMERIVAAFETHNAILGTEILEEFRRMKVLFIAARGIQLSQKAKVSDASGDADTTGLALQLQLTSNVHTTALKNIDNPDAATLFFDQSILDLGNSSTEEVTTPPTP